MNMPKFKFVDLSTPIANPTEEEAKDEYVSARTPRITYKDHTVMLPTVKNLLGCTEEDLPDGLGWANEVITLSTHHGTHMDSPYHYFPTTAGEPAMTISDLPLDMFFGPLVVLDLRHIKKRTIVTEQDIKDALKKINYTIKPGDIVGLWYGTDELLGTMDYWAQYPGMSAEATLYLINQGVKVMGTDAMGFDLPFDQIKENFAKNKDKSKLWEAHRVGKDHAYCHIEKFAHLGDMPATGGYIACFPVLIEKTSAAWCRCVGLIPTEE